QGRVVPPVVAPREVNEVVGHVFPAHEVASHLLSLHRLTLEGKRAIGRVYRVRSQLLPRTGRWMTSDCWYRLSWPAGGEKRFCMPTCSWDSVVRSNDGSSADVGRSSPASDATANV